MNNAWCYFVLPFFPLSLSPSSTLSIDDVHVQAIFAFPLSHCSHPCAVAYRGFEFFTFHTKHSLKCFEKWKTSANERIKRIRNKNRRMHCTIWFVHCTISPSHWKRKWNIITSQTNALQSISISWMQRFPSLFYTIYSQWLASSIEKILFSHSIYRCLNPTHNICIEMLGWDIQQQRPTKRLEWKMER